MNSLPVVIYCGGQGTRMRGDRAIKKELVEIGGRPIIWHVMRIFSAHGFNHFVLPLGYGVDQMKRYFIDYEQMSRDCAIHLGSAEPLRFHGDLPHPAWQIDLIDTGLNSDKATRLKKVEPYLSAERFFVTYGDGVSDIDLQALLTFHRQHGKLVTITAIQPGGYQYGTMDADSSGRVTAYHQYPPLPYWINAGFMIFERAVLDQIDPDASVALETELLQQLVAQGEVMLYRHHGFWQSMDTYKDTLVLEELWQTDAPWKVW